MLPCMSSGLGAVKGWCMASNRCPSSFHSNRGKSAKYQNVFFTDVPLLGSQHVAHMYLQQNQQNQRQNLWNGNSHKGLSAMCHWCRAYATDPC